MVSQRVLAALRLHRGEGRTVALLVAIAFFADEVTTLDRREIRASVLDRFSAARMADRYEALYARLTQGKPAPEGARSEATSPGTRTLREPVQMTGGTAGRT